MKYSALRIKRAFGHKLIGNSYMKRVLCRSLLIFPNEIIGFVTKHCWFVSSFDDGWAFVLQGEDLKKGEYLIFLSDELLKEDEKQIKYTIAHEVGHVILGHKNSIRKIQTKSEIRKQEKEADEFAKKFLNP